MYRLPTHLLIIRHLPCFIDGGIMSARTYYIVRKRALFSGCLFCSLQKNKESFTGKFLLRIYLGMACQLITQIRTSKLPCGFWMIIICLAFPWYYECNKEAREAHSTLRKLSSKRYLEFCIYCIWYLQHLTHMSCRTPATLHSNYLHNNLSS